jgi:DNA-binding transcriptional LysR family regulator
MVMRNPKGLGFSRAAESLDIPRPTATLAIQELGVRLWTA